MGTTHTLEGKNILFACVPGDGHFNPLTGLAKHLQGIGCNVKWYASAVYSNKLEKLGIEHYPFTKAMDIPSDKIDEVFPQRALIKSQVKKLNFDMINYFILRSTEYLEDIKDINQNWQVDAIVADCLFSAIPFIHNALGIPVISIGVLPLIQTSKDLAPAGLGMEPSYSFIGKVKQDLLKTLANKVLFKKPNQLFFSLLRERNIPVNAPNAFDSLVNSATRFLQSGTPGFEYRRSDLGKHIRYIGALLPYSDPKKERVLWADSRLNTYTKKVLVTQGTVEKDVTKLLTPAIEAFKNTDTLLIVTTGGSKTQELRNKYKADNIIIEDFIAFDDVLPHVDLFITNGGYGGVIQSIQYGVPIIAAGVHEGKNEICARIGYLQYGINLRTETPKPAQLKKAVENIAATNLYKNNVQKLAKEFREYDVHKLVEKYVLEAIQSFRN